MKKIATALITVMAINIIAPVQAFAHYRTYYGWGRHHYHSAWKGGAIVAGTLAAIMLIDGHNRHVKKVKAEKRRLEALQNTPCQGQCENHKIIVEEPPAPRRLTTSEIFRQEAQS